MIFLETPLAGAFVIELEPAADDRGYFARTYDSAEFRERGLDAAPLQCSLSLNRERGTLRGLHYQVAPHEERKLVRCTRGAIFDVLVDLRPDSDTYCSWFGIELDADTGRSLYVPEGLAHGFLTVVDRSEVFYQISHPFTREAARGVRWDDPAFAIEWPEPVRVISERDRAYPDFRP